MEQAKISNPFSEEDGEQNGLIWLYIRIKQTTLCALKSF